MIYSRCQIYQCFDAACVMNGCTGLHLVGEENGHCPCPETVRIPAALLGVARKASLGQSGGSLKPQAAWSRHSSTSTDPDEPEAKMEVDNTAEQDQDPVWDPTSREEAHHHIYNTERFPTVATFAMSKSADPDLVSGIVTSTLIDMGIVTKEDTSLGK